MASTRASSRVSFVTKSPQSLSPASEKRGAYMRYTPMHRRCCLIVILLALLAVLPAPAGAPKKKLLLLAQGPDGHPPETHEYLRGQQVLQKALEKSANLDITLARADEP